MKCPDGKVRLEYFNNGQSMPVKGTTVSFFLMPDVDTIAFSVINKGEYVNPQKLGILDPSIKLQEIELPKEELSGSALDKNLRVVAPLDGGSFLVFHRCSVERIHFWSDYMIPKEMREFTSSIAVLSMEPSA